jgi:hypothetical protein
MNDKEDTPMTKQFLVFIVAISLTLSATTVFAGQGVQRLLYTVTVRNCELDCIQLHGNGNSTFDNEMAGL